MIKDRMDVAKAWRLTQKADFILKLRSLRVSGNFEDYWKFYELQEYSRNYKNINILFQEKMSRWIIAYIQANEIRHI